jgi:hypothetical protein
MTKQQEEMAEELLQLMDLQKELNAEIALKYQAFIISLLQDK